MRRLPLDSEVQGHSKDLFLLKLLTWHICSNGVMYIGFSLNILCTITPLLDQQQESVSPRYCGRAWESRNLHHLKFSLQMRLSRKPQPHTLTTLCNWKPEITWPFSINHTLFPCLGTLLISGPVSNITSLMKGPLTTDFPFPLPRNGLCPEVVNCLRKFGM